MPNKIVSIHIDLPEAVADEVIAVLDALLVKKPGVVISSEFCGASTHIVAHTCVPTDGSDTASVVATDEPVVSTAPTPGDPPPADPVLDEPSKDSEMTVTLATSDGDGGVGEIQPVTDEPIADPVEPAEDETKHVEPQELPYNLFVYKLSTIAPVLAKKNRDISTDELYVRNLKADEFQVSFEALGSQYYFPIKKDEAGNFLFESPTHFENELTVTRLFKLFNSEEVYAVIASHDQIPAE